MKDTPLRVPHTYAAFLRGINVGGNTLVKMDDLKVLFEARGFKNVRTIINSGNVLFETPRKDIEEMERHIETALKKKYKREIIVMIRTIEELRKLEASHPFKRVKIKPNTRLYVTFLAEPTGGVKIPKPGPGFEILQIKNKDVFSVVEILPDVDTTDSMAFIGKIFGPRVTMRNWNTILKVIKVTQNPEE